jgi:hypothetical protein
MVIDGREQLVRWLNARSDEANANGSITATFVIDQHGKLRLASRRSEHVACASGGPVLSAGEISFLPTGDVVDVSNHSTGFCPEPESWISCAESLDRVGVVHPNAFTRQVIFRRCPKCKERNIVKDGWYVCELCGGELPAKWIFQ